jgi:hypothetical protein
LFQEGRKVIEGRTKMKEKEKGRTIIGGRKEGQVLKETKLIIKEGSLWKEEVSLLKEGRKESRTKEDY